MTARFNPAPGWPPTPEGWTPPKGWTHPNEWPSSPAGWLFWVDDVTGEPTDDPTTPPKRAWFKRKRVLIPAGVVLLMTASGMAGADESEPVAVSAPSPSVSTPAQDEASAEAEASAAASEEAAAEAAAAEALAAEEAAPEVAAAEAAAAEAAAVEAAAALAVAEQAAAEEAADEAAAAAGWTVTNIVDGDTIDVERDGTTERIRIIGIDTPEQGECGFEESSTAMGAVVGGQQVTLGIEARDERDRYGRLIAYVDTLDGTDAGLTLIQDGMGIARYDSRDGYGEHPREAAYVTADAASPVAYSCDDPAPAPEPVEEEEEEEEQPAPAAEPDDGGGSVFYQNCDAVRAGGADPIRVGDPGWDTKFDRDGDGVGCE